jgi:hypothetical protein
MSKYNEIMEHLELRPEMEEKILANLREEQDSLKAAAVAQKVHAADKAGAAGISSAAGGVVIPERRDAEVSHAVRSAGGKHGSGPQGKWKKFALGAAAAAMVCVMAGQGFYDQYINDTSGSGSGVSDHQTAVEQQESGGSGVKDISSGSSSGSGNGSGSSGAQAASEAAGNSGTGASDSVSTSGNSSHRKDSGSSSGSSKKNDSGNSSNKSSDDSSEDNDDKPVKKTAMTIRSIADASDALAKVRIISEEGPDSDGFYTYTAEVTDVVYGKVDSNVMTVCLFDSQGKPQLSPGDSAYFFLKDLGNDEFYITKEDAGVVRISGGEVVFADGVTFTGYRQDSNYRMRETDFVRYLN